jgi:hypothetical protein
VWVKLRPGLLAAIVAGVTLFTLAAIPANARTECGSGYIAAHLSWGDKCLRDGEFCKVGNPEYRAYGFDCAADGHLTSYATAQTTPAAAAVPTPVAPAVGRTVLLHKRTRTSRCALGSRPDARCSPGAYYSGLTTAVICSASFRTSSVRNVPDSEKHAVEVGYGLAPKGYGSSLETDHIVSLELGGSNDIANLFPEQAAFANHSPGFHVKDALENRIHDMVCAGQLSLRSAQQQIAANWQALYTKVYGVPPSG